MNNLFHPVNYPANGIQATNASIYYAQPPLTAVTKEADAQTREASPPLQTDLANRIHTLRPTHSNKGQESVRIDISRDAQRTGIRPLKKLKTSNPDGQLTVPKIAVAAQTIVPKVAVAAQTTVARKVDQNQLLTRNLTVEINEELPGFPNSVRQSDSRSKRKRGDETAESGWQEKISAAQASLVKVNAERDSQNKKFHEDALQRYTSDAQGELHLQNGAISMNTFQFRDVMNRVAALVAQDDVSISEQGAILPSAFPNTKEAGEKESILTKMQDKNLIVLKKLNKLGAGSNGIAHRVVDLVQGKFLALKTAKNSEKFSNIRNESRILKLIHAAGQKPNIQPAPIADFDLPGSNLVAQLSPLFAGDLHKQLRKNPNLPFKTKLKYITQLLQGLKGLQEAGIWHGDIKLSNIWIDESDNLLIGDFDGAVTMKEVMENMSTPRSFTPITCNFTDFELRTQLIEHEDADALQEFALGMDLYSVSVCIFAILTSTSAKPFKYIEDTPGHFYIHPDANLKDLAIRIKYSKVLSDFLGKMLDHDMSDRPTLEECIKFWSGIDEETALRSLPKTPECEVPSDDECLSGESDSDEAGDEESNVSSSIHTSTDKLLKSGESSAASSEGVPASSIPKTPNPGSLTSSAKKSEIIDIIN